ncbi:hypothetical protein [Streptomyces glaucus]|uniref:hypothetical protein n=1 Tax=Streptomyces glaucus TaxID=284029 RepID=UPI0031D79DA3
MKHFPAEPADQDVDVFLFLRAAPDREAMSRVRALLRRARSPLPALGYGVADLLH